ncbi:hypothetical protein [Nocardia huaxiensis]|uniref:hypothetical protein n=1 Tax=Nocardia huaxiensis TaxID=2755382 RepID=UPI001E5ACE40|nr:hypothetical protein [Nocardia huaxiensis]UFS99637.1 hypothetical protein LPY97_18010 [Nocardia huaxiensis]
MGPRPDGPEVLRRSARRIQLGAEREQIRISHSDVDPDYIRQLEDFGSLSHAHIHACVQAMDPGAMRSLSDTWVSIADSLAGAVNGLHMTMQSALAEGLAGQIADAAETAANQFTRQAMDVTEVAHITGLRIESAACAAEALRKTVPPPVDPSAPEADEQFQLALAAIEANYVPFYPAAGSGVPAFAPIEMPGGGEGSAVPGSATGSGGSGHGRSGYATRTTDFLAVPPGSNDYQSIRPADAPGGTPDRVSPGADPRGSAGYSGWEYSNPATEFADPAVAPTADRPTDPSTDPAASGGGHSPALTAPGLSGLPASPGSPDGTTVPYDTRGNPTAPLSATPATPFAASPRTGPGAVGWMPGAYPPGGRAGTDPDSSRNTPDWLIRDREDELFGTPPTTVPAVLGAEIPAADNTCARTEDDRSR